MKSQKVDLVLAAMAGLICITQAQADSVLEIISGSVATGITVSPGVVSANSVTVGGWTIAVAEGMTQPATGSLSDPQDDIDSVNILSSGSSPLYIEFSAGGFTAPTPTTMLASISGVSLGGGLSGTYSTYYSPSVFSGTVANPLPPLADEMTSQSFSSSDLTGSITGVVKSGDPFALTQVIEITHGLGSLDDTLSLIPSSTVHVPDGGVTVILLGGTIMGLALARSKFANRG